MKRLAISVRRILLALLALALAYLLWLFGWVLYLSLIHISEPTRPY